MQEPEHPLLSVLEADLRERVRREARVIELPAGQPVFRPGDVCESLPLVLKGSVRVQMAGASGNEIVLYRIGDDDVCTLSIGCLMADRGYRAEAVVERHTTAVVLTAGLFDALMAASSGFRREVMAAYGRRLDTLMLVIEEVAFRRMDARLAAWLAARAPESPLAITHQELAVEFGTAREVVSRLLKEFERSGLLRLGRGRIQVLDVPGLSRLAGDF